jgi:hypothetical protein
VSAEWLRSKKIEGKEKKIEVFVWVGKGASSSHVPIAIG